MKMVKVADGREISMDSVAKPTHYEAPGVRTYPQGTQGWVLVHYSATTMCLLPVHFYFSGLQSDK